MKKLWKVLIPVLAFAVVFACVFALGASADTPQAAITEGTDEAAGLFRVLDASGKELGNDFKTLGSAITATPDGGTVQVLADYNAASGIAMQNNSTARNITVDLMGHTVYEASSWANYSQYFLVRHGNGLKITSSEGRGKFVFSKYMLLVQADINTNSQTLTNKVEIENIDVESSVDKYYIVKAGTGTLSLKNMNIKATSANVQPVQFQRDTNSSSLNVTMDNVVIDSAKLGVHYIGSGTDAFALNVNISNCKITSAHTGSIDYDGMIRFASVTGNNDSINLVMNNTEIYTNQKGAITADNNPQISITADNCTLHTDVDGSIPVKKADDTSNDAAWLFRAAAGLTKQGTIKFTNSDISVFRRIVDTGYGAEDTEHNTSFIFDDCKIYSRAADCIAVTAGNNFTFSGMKTRLISPAVNVWDKAAGNPGTTTYGKGIRAAASVGGFAEDGLETDGCKYVYGVGAIKYEGSQQGDNSVYNNQIVNGANYGTETKDVVNPADGQLYRQLWVLGKGTNNTYPWLNPTKSVITPGANLKYLAFEMDISVLEDMPDQVDIYFMGRNSGGGDFLANSDYYVLIKKADGGVNFTFNGKTHFVKIGHWAHLTMVYRLSTEFVDGVNQTALSVFVDGEHLSTTNTGCFKTGFAKISDGRINLRFNGAEGTNAHINIANLRLASYADADFESNVFSATPTVEGSAYLAGAHSDMKDSSANFHFSDGTTEENVYVSAGATATTVGKDFFSKQATLAYNAKKVLLGWSKSEGGELFSGALTDEDIKAGLDFYPVLVDFAAAKDTVQAVMLEGTTVKAYLNSDNFHNIDADGKLINDAPLSNVTVGSKTYVMLINDMTVYGAAEINGSSDINNGALTKVYVDLNGHKLTADYANWKSHPGYKYIFRICNLVTFYTYSSVEGAVIDAGDAALVMQNHTHEVLIGADSSGNAKQGKNPYAGYLTIKTNDFVVRNNAADGVCVSGVTIEAANGFNFRVLTKRTDAKGILTFAIRDCDITVTGNLISFAPDAGQTSTLSVAIEKSTLLVGGRLLDNPPDSAVASANITVNMTATNSNLYVNDTTIPDKMDGTVDLTGNEVYVNKADEKLVIDAGKEFVNETTEFGGMTFALKLAVPAPMKVEKAGMTLGGKFVLNFYIKLSNATTAQYKDTAYVTVLLPNGETLTLKLADLEKDADGRYIVSVTVAAAEMADKITVTGMLDTETAGTEYTLSVRGYCDLVLADEATSEKAKTLIKAMLNYGAEAQLAFKYHTDNLANAGLFGEGENPLDGDVTSDAATTVTGTVTGLKTNSMTLSLLDTVTLKLYFRSDKTDAYTFALVTEDGDVAITPAEEEDGYRVDIEGILAADLAKAVTIKITNEIDGTEMTVTVSPLAYAAGVLAGEGADAEQVRLAKALVLMQLAAADYAAED